MMEILINEFDWKTTKKMKRLAEIIEKLKNSGWEKFGHDGTVVLFKDTTEENVKLELKRLGINEVKAKFWEEDLYNNNIF